MPPGFMEGDDAAGHDGPVDVKVNAGSMEDFQAPGPADVPAPAVAPAITGQAEDAVGGDGPEIIFQGGVAVQENGCIIFQDADLFMEPDHLLIRGLGIH